MSGRRPRRTRDEQSNVTPLHGERVRALPGQSRPGTERVRGPGRPGLSGIGEDGVWRPVNPTQRPPFQPGHDPRRDKAAEASTTHGAKTPAKVEEKAREIQAGALGNPAWPDHLRSPMFGPAVWAWAKAEAAEDMIWSYICDQGLEMAMTLKPGASRALMDIWMAAHTRAGNARKDLGLTPASYAKIVKDLGLQEKATEAALQGLAATGASITARREIES